MLIDFHTHAFPQKIANRAIATLEQNIITHTGDGDFAHAKYGGTLEELREFMKDNDVDISVVLPIATTTTQSASINRFAAEINNLPGIKSFGSLHPLQENPEEELLKIKKLGLKGIKLHPEYQGFFIDSPESVRVIKAAQDLGLWVVLHTGRDLGMPPPVHCSPKALYQVLEQVSGENIIAAHMGGYLMWEDVLKYLAGSSITLDTSYCLAEMPEEISSQIIKKHTADKIIFGSDAPWNEPKTILSALKKLNLPKEDFEKITYKNACKILGL